MVSISFATPFSRLLVTRAMRLKLFIFCLHRHFCFLKQAASRQFLPLWIWKHKAIADLSVIFAILTIGHLFYFMFLASIEWEEELESRTARSTTGPWHGWKRPSHELQSCRLHLQILARRSRMEKSIADWHEARRYPICTPLPIHAETTLERKRGGSQIYEAPSILSK